MSDEDDKPSSAHFARYDATNSPSAPDGRIYSQTFPRNSPPTIAQLSRWLLSRSGKVLEIGSGTGRHAAAFSLAFPNLEWWPSDPEEIHRNSTAAWQRHVKAPERPPIALDAATNWADLPEIAKLAPFEAVFAMNVLHIAPPAVMEGIVTGASNVLNSKGLLIFYGPFQENGQHTGEGNRKFDERLRADNPEWGLRDTVEVAGLAEKSGLTLAEIIVMPANNRLLVFTKDS